MYQSQFMSASNRSKMNFVVVKNSNSTIFDLTIF